MSTSTQNGNGVTKAMPVILGIFTATAIIISVVVTYVNSLEQKLNGKVETINQRLNNLEGLAEKSIEDRSAIREGNTRQIEKFVEVETQIAGIKKIIELNDQYYKYRFDELKKKTQ